MISQADAKERYLFLFSLREIAVTKPECLLDELHNVQKLLLEQTAHNDESVRGIVAECLGRLFSKYPEEMIETIETGLQNQNILVKGTVAKSSKFAGQSMNEEHQLMYSLLAGNLVKLKTESDPDVKRNALEGFTAMVHTNWRFVANELADI